MALKRNTLIINNVATLVPCLHVYTISGGYARLITVAHPHEKKSRTGTYACTSKERLHVFTRKHRHSDAVCTHHNMYVNATCATSTSVQNCSLNYQQRVLSAKGVEICYMHSRSLLFCHNYQVRRFLLLLSSLHAHQQRSTVTKERTDRKPRPILRHQR